MSTIQNRTPHKKYSLPIVIAFYSVLVIIIGLLLFGCVKSYIHHQQFTVEKVPEKSFSKFLTEGKLTGEDGQLKAIFNELEWNQLLTASLLDKETSKVNGKLEAIQYDLKNQQVYMEVVRNQQVYSFIADATHKIDDGKWQMKLSKYRLGSYKSRLLGMVFAKNLHIPVSLTIDLDSPDQLLALHKIDEVDKKSVKAIFVYNNEKLIEKIDGYKESLNAAKVELQGKSADDKTAGMIKLLEKESTSEEDAAQFIRLMEEDEEAVVKLAMLLDEEGIRELLNDFSPYYAKRVNLEHVLVKSASKLENKLSADHSDLSRKLLNYLYHHKNYTATDRQLLINGSAVTANQVGANLEYDVTIENQDSAIVGQYMLGGKTMSKTILRKHSGNMSNEKIE